MPTLCSRQQVKDRLGITSISDDAQIDSIITAVTQVIMRRYGREFVTTTLGVARTFAVKSRYVDLAPYDLSSATLVQLNPEEANPLTLIANTDYVLKPIGGAEKTGTYLGIRLSDLLNIESNFFRQFGVAQIKITGNWGIWADFANVAEDVNEAAIETAVSWMDRGALKITGISELGEPSHNTPSTAQGWDIPTSSHRKLMPYNVRNLGIY